MPDDGQAPRSGWRTAAAAGVVGLLLGASVTQLQDHRYAGTLAERLRICQVDGARQRVEARRLRERVQALSQQPSQSPVVTEVRLDLTGPGPSLADLEAALEPVTSALLGVPVARLEPDLVWQALNNRQVTILGRRYRITTRALLISSRTRILVQATPEGP